jgi:hypothetical protein
MRDGGGSGGGANVVIDEVDMGKGPGGEKVCPVMVYEGLSLEWR